MKRERVASYTNRRNAYTLYTHTKIHSYAYMVGRSVGLSVIISRERERERDRVQSKYFSYLN